MHVQVLNSVLIGAIECSKGVTSTRGCVSKYFFASKSNWVLFSFKMYENYFYIWIQPLITFSKNWASTHCFFFIFICYFIAPIFKSLDFFHLASGFQTDFLPLFSNYIQTYLSFCPYSIKIISQEIF